MDFLAFAFMGKPLWMWLGFMGVVAALLAFDLGVMHRRDHEIGVRESLTLSGFYIVLALAFGGWIWWELGEEAAVEYVTGFVVEKSLAMDNVFVIALIFNFFAVPRQLQHRVLFWGIIGVVVLRAVMIGLGAALVARFGWVLYIFALFLIFTGIKLLRDGQTRPDLSQTPVLRFVYRHFRTTPTLQGHNFFVRLHDANRGRKVVYATPLFLALLMIELADIVFAVDSVPAIFAITLDPYIIYTSNIFAVLGLRALYFALAAILHRFAYLKQALAVLLVFIGAKIFVADLFGWEKFPAQWSLAVTFAILAAGVAYSLWRTREAPAPQTEAAPRP